jgi:hypothetical protein
VRHCRGRLLSVCVIVVLLGAVEPSASGATLAERRLALYPDPPPNAPSDEWARRAWAIADLEERAGNPDLAAAALSRALQRTGLEAAIDALTEDPDRTRATSLFDEAVRRAVACAKRTRDANLLLEALAWQPDLIDKEPAAVSDAVLVEGYQVSLGLRERVRAALGTTPAWRAFLEQEWPPEPSPGEAARGPRPDDGLEALGDLGVTILVARLSDALADGDANAVRRLADRIWSADRWNLKARIVRHLLDDIGRGVGISLEDVGLVLDGAPSSKTVVAKLDRVRMTRPDALGVSLAIAYSLEAVHLFADAQREATRVLGSPAATAEQRSTAQAVVILAKLATGPDAEGEAAAWQRASGAGQSLSWVQTILGRRGGWEFAAPKGPVGALDRTALERVFADPFGPTTASLQNRWARRAALALDVPELRDRALAVLAKNNRDAARLIQSCIDAAVAFDECNERLDLLDDLDDEERDVSPAPADVLRRLTDFPAARLASLAYADAKELARLEPALDRLRNDRYDGTPGFVQLQMAVHLARRDWGSARAAFARGGALLPLDVRTSIRLALAGKDSRRTPLRTAALTKNEPFILQPLPRSSLVALASRAGKDAAPDRDPEDDAQEGGDSETEAPDDGGVAKLVTLLWRHGQHPRRVLSTLGPRWQQVDGAEGAELAGWMWTVARDLDDSFLARRALKRMTQLAPLGAATSRALAELALERANGKTARIAARRLWLLDPGGAAAVAGSLFASAWLEGTSSASITSASAEWVGRLGDRFPSTVWNRMARAIRDRRLLPLSDLATIVGAERDPERALALSPNLFDAFRIDSWAEARLAALPPESAVSLAKKVSGYLARRPAHTAAPGLAFWAAFLAGDERSAAQARKDAPSTEKRFRKTNHGPYVRPIASPEAAELLAGLHVPLAPALRQDLFKWFGRFGRSKGDVPASVDVAAGAAQDKADAALLRQLACVAAERPGRSRQALGMCARAWGADAGRSRIVATTLSRLLAGDPDAARAENIDGAAFFREARAAFSGRPPAALLNAEAVWLSKAGRNKEAATLEAQAWVAGYQLEGARPPNVIEWAPYEPLLTRVMLAVVPLPGPEGSLVLGTAALASGDVEIAMPHLRVAAAGAKTPKERSEKQQWARFLVDVAEVAAADLANRRIDEGAVSESFMSVLHKTSRGTMPGLLRRYPRSLYLALLAADDSTGRSQALPAALVSEMMRAFPQNVLVLHEAIRGLILDKKYAEASALLAKALAAHPGDTLLQALTAAGAGGSGGSTALPAWAASPPAFAQAIAKAELSNALVDKARLESEGNEAFDVYVPDEFTKVAAGTFLISHDGVNLSIGRIPRVTYCAGPACLEMLVPTLAQQGLDEQWSRAVRLPIGDGQEGLFRGPGGLAIVTAVPVGPYVFFLSAGGAPDKLAAALPAVRLLRETLRYRDAALGPVRTALLRDRGSLAWAADRIGAGVRTELAAASGSGCPIATALRDLTGGSRSDLVAGLYLSAGRATDRIRLLRCLSGARDATAPLALATTWDTEPEANAFGRAALVRNAVSVVRTLERGVDLTTAETNYDSTSDREDLLAGVIQVLALLPVESGRELGERLLASGDARLRALAIVAVHWVPDVLPRQQVETLLRSGPDDDVIVLAAALSPGAVAPASDAIRARLAAMGDKPTALQRRVASLLVPLLAPLQDGKDGALLARLRKLFDPGAAQGVQEAKRVVVAIDAHALATGGSGHSVDARMLLERWRALSTEKKTNVARKELDRPMAERFPTHGWSYFSIGAPAVFLASLTDLANGISSGGNGRASTGKFLMSRMLSTLGAEDASHSGLDLDRPFECASSNGGAEGWACTAALSDVAAARRGLVASADLRALVTLPRSAGAVATLLPTMSLFLPMLLPRDPPAPAPGDAAPQTGWLVTEKVGDMVREANIDLIRTADLRIRRDHGVAIDESLMYVSDHRVWLFSDLEAARLWLTRPSGDAAFAKWGTDTSRAGAPALVGWSPAGEDDDVPNGFRLAAEQTSDGVQIRISTPMGRASLADTKGLAERLPAGAVLSFVAPNVAAAPVWGFKSLGLLSQSDELPPLWLWQAADAAAFGWYPPDGAHGEDEWVSALRWSPTVEEAWRAHDLPFPSPMVASAGRISFVRLGAFLLLGTRKQLLGSPLKLQVAQTVGISSARPPLTASATGEMLVGLLEHRASVAQIGEGVANDLRAIAAMTALIASVETRASVRDDTFTSETRVRQSFAASHVGSSVDELLRNQQLKNSLRLPQPLDQEAAERGVTLRLKGLSAESMRRAFPDSDRLTLTELSPGVFQAKILPRPRDPKPASLSSRERDLYITPDGTPAPGALRAAATDIAGKAASAWDRMRAVVDWVSREMKYELTPRHLDDLTLLEVRRGDCTEYAQLTIALLRALGIPARMRVGLAGEGSMLVAHAWVEFHDGVGWHEIDPTAGRTSVDASYVDASVMDLLPLLANGGVHVIAVE